MIRHVPVPSTQEYLDAFGPHIAPFLPSIAKRARVTPGELAGEILRGEVQAHLAWDDEKQEAKALLGTRMIPRGQDRICELAWMTGKGRHHWQDLLPSVELWAREHMGCAGMRPVARPGWTPTLKAHGYRVTHVVMEKDF